MKIAFNVRYRGKIYRNSQPALNDTIADGLVATIREKIMPFENEIHSEGGHVDLEINPGYKVAVKINNVSEALKQKIDNRLKTF